MCVWNWWERSLLFSWLEGVSMLPIDCLCWSCCCLFVCSGCHCRRSSCLKNYCECFEVGATSSNNYLGSQQKLFAVHETNTGRHRYLYANTCRPALLCVKDTCSCWRGGRGWEGYGGASWNEWCTCSFCRRQKNFCDCPYADSHSGVHGGTYRKVHLKFHQWKNFILKEFGWLYYWALPFQ